MRVMLAVAACAALVSGCESMNQKVDASRQDRCQRADWAQVGERDGMAGSPLLADRYEYVCGDMFQSGPYKQGFDKGRAAKPRPPA
jgi:hypothetical protein